MSRTRKSSADKAAQQAVKDVEKHVKEIRKKQRELLKKSGSDMRSFRHQVAELKKAGAVAKWVDVRHQEPTRYMRSKLKKFADVLSGKSVVVKAPREVRDKYRNSGVLEVRGSLIVVPKEREGQRTRIRRGLVEVIKPMKHGQEEAVILPFKLTDMEEIAERLKDDPSLDGLKQPDEQFAFRMFGHNSQLGFPDAESMGEYISLRYKHLFKPDQSDRAIAELRFLRFKGYTVPPSKETKIYDIKSPKRPDAKGRNSGRLTYYQVQEMETYLRKQREKKAKQRAKESPAKREARLERQREYQRDYRDKRGK